jgi:hypothetical protein
MIRRGLFVVLAMAHTASAQALATDSPTLGRGWNAGLGAELGFGTTYVDGLDNGWVGRLQYHMMPFLPDPGTFGGLFDLSLGYEYWRVGRGTWGMDIPFEMQLGFRAWAVRFEGGVGVDAVLLDQVHGDTGFGMYAPLASITAGFDFHHTTVMADVRVVRRWQLGADDFTQWMFSVGIGGTEESNRPRRASVAR